MPNGPTWSRRPQGSSRPRDTSVTFAAGLLLRDSDWLRDPLKRTNR
jgi:hypothetical protein